MPRLPRHLQGEQAINQANQLLQRYSDWGWYLHPLAPRSKEPISAHGFKDAVHDLQQWQRWLKQGKNLGCATEASRLLVIDFDNGSPDSLGFRLPPTRVHSTPRPGSGYHWFYRLPDGADPPPSSNGEIAPGVDIKCAGGYVVVPPSHIDDYAEVGSDGLYKVVLDWEPAR